jgi:hypothetical protein
LRTTINGFISDRPKWDDFTTVSNGYNNVPVHWPNDNSTAIQFWTCDNLVTKTLYFKATTRDLQVRILGSLDRGLTFPITVEAEFNVLVATPVRKDINEDYHALKIQVKPLVDGAYGVLSTSGGGSSLTPSTNLDIGDISVTVPTTDATTTLSVGMLTMDGDSQDITIPVGSKWALLFARSGPVYYMIDDDADIEIGGYIPEDGNTVVFLEDISQLSVIGASGTFCHYNVYG